MVQPRPWMGGNAFSNYRLKGIGGVVALGTPWKRRIFFLQIIGPMVLEFVFSV